MCIVDVEEGQGVRASGPGNDTAAAAARATAEAEEENSQQTCPNTAMMLPQGFVRRSCSAWRLEVLRSGLRQGRRSCVPLGAEWLHLTTNHFRVGSM